MSEGSLSQEEIDALLAHPQDAGADAAGAAEDVAAEADVEVAATLVEEAPAEVEADASFDPADAAGSRPDLEGMLGAHERDALGEIGNICMSSAATTLSSILGHPVAITTPRVSVVDEARIRADFAAPACLVSVEYTAGVPGRSVFLVGQEHAAVVADLMMGGDGQPSETALDEMRLSAVSEAMNQMMGSATTAMAQMISRKVDIACPEVQLIDFADQDVHLGLSDDDIMVRVVFDLQVGDLISTRLMQLMDLHFAVELVSGMLGAAEAAPAAAVAPEPVAVGVGAAPVEDLQAATLAPAPPLGGAYGLPSLDLDASFGAGGGNALPPPLPGPVVQPVSFPSLVDTPSGMPAGDIGLLLDVQLEVTVELGRTRRRIRDVLDLVPGSIVELDKLAGEPVDVLVNGKKIAKGEVVVIDEDFGVRITEIASRARRLRDINDGEE